MRESDREGRIMIKVIKKDGTKEEFNVQKVVVAVNKSAYRALVTFTEEELDFICNFVTEKVEQMRKKEVTISDMHNVVEGALEQTNPLVAKSYRDYRNYKQDFVQMLHRRQEQRQYRQRSGGHQAKPDLQRAEQGALPEILHEPGRTSGLQGRLHLHPRPVRPPGYDELLSV